MLQWFTSYNDACCASCPLHLAHSSLAEYPAPYLAFYYLADSHLALYPRPQRDWTRPIMLIVLFLVSHFNFLFVPCGGLSWLPVSFLMHVKYTLSYRIVSYVKNSKCSTLLGLCNSPIRPTIVTIGSIYFNTTVSIFYSHITIIKIQKKTCISQNDAKNETILHSYFK